MSETSESESVYVKDKLNVPLGVGDYALIAHNGPYLNFARVWRAQTSPRPLLEFVEAYQPENNPSLAFLVRVQSICSPHRLIRISREQVPPEIRTLLEQAVSKW